MQPESGQESARIHDWPRAIGKRLEQWADPPIAIFATVGASNRLERSCGNKESSKRKRHAEATQAFHQFDQIARQRADLLGTVVVG